MFLDTSEVGMAQEQNQMELQHGDILPPNLPGNQPGTVVYLFDQDLAFVSVSGVDPYEWQVTQLFEGHISPMSGHMQPGL